MREVGLHWRPGRLGAAESPASFLDGPTSALARRLQWAGLSWRRAKRAGNFRRPAAREYGGTPRTIESSSGSGG